jgi:hypothetical protein
MTKRPVQCRTGLLAAVGTIALLAVVAVPVAAGGNGHGNGRGKTNNRLLAAGTATERVGTGQWHIKFQIHARNNGKSSKVSVQTPNSKVAYVGSVCSGSYTTAAGTTVYVVGRQTSSTGPGFTGVPYDGYSIHKGGPMGADFSWVSSFASLAAAQTACANPAVFLPTPFPLDAASVRFKV